MPSHNGGRYRSPQTSVPGAAAHPTEWSLGAGCPNVSRAAVGVITFDRADDGQSGRQHTGDF
jgi:hypothetical protein